MVVCLAFFAIKSSPLRKFLKKDHISLGLSNKAPSHVILDLSCKGAGEEQVAVTWEQPSIAQAYLKMHNQPEDERVSSGNLLMIFIFLYFFSIAVSCQLLPLLLFTPVSNP